MNTSNEVSRCCGSLGIDAETWKSNGFLFVMVASETDAEISDSLIDVTVAGGENELRDPSPVGH